ncbi:uncharacterized protein LOC123556848 [Mercenaria mercenaria]|uniref:uncharacterized protein LOC123556848 n=1 Tax=Mercenaria mercenaria TaxID=6596 RepID=UPI00234F75CF|nr:uncharacterized protein LOC123556848 [Mercenaria mercenaria]XP_053399082.1 uncharacterized protein LOC123556848 [Mercenaria mercenaria]XP_053399083.1 uncharacterized protein LOC123556848 [Mercenaria mercenaria]XP_053399084.1 uncharacterized protein LOC123556848 [Mercenaria mercenaria]
MESHIKFIDSDWDDASELSTLHLSYLVQLLLPVRHVGWKKENTFHKPFNIPLISGIDHTCIPTGSTAEGLNIPKCIVNNSSMFEVFSDTDLLCVSYCLKISTREIHGTGSGFSGYFDYNENMAPGYTKICFIDEVTNKDVLTFDSKSGKHFLNRENFIKGAYSDAKVHLETDKDTSIQGPALSVTEQELVEFKGKFDQHAGVSRDIVLALPCAPWPTIADKWKQRAKLSSWLQLQPSLVESIIEDGCHVVGTPPKKSQNPDLEWRISFSASEGRLAREAVTDHQRQCYIYLKILRHQVMKPDPVLSSYVFKSVFFYACEKLPVSFWRDRPGNCILYMLDLLLECLKRRHVPTYFVPENNLINHLSEAELDMAIFQVQNLRDNPISPVLEFTNRRSFAYHSQIVPFSSMAQPLLDDMKTFAAHRDRRRAVNDGFLLTAVTICQFYLLEHMGEQYKEFEVQKHQEGIQTLIHLYNQWLKPSQFSVPPLVSFIASIGFEMEDHAQSCDFYEAVVTLGDVYPEFLDLRGNLASLYHSSAYTFTDTSARDKYLRKANDLFKELYNENTHCVIDYVTYLVKENQFEEAKCVIEEFLDKADETTNIVFSYSIKEMEIIDDNLRKHVQAHGIVFGDALSFAYYYLVKCLCSLQQQSLSQVSEALCKLEQHCKETKTESSFDFYNEAKTMSAESKHNLPFISPATTCMLIAAVFPSLFTLIIRAIRRR